MAPINKKIRAMMLNKLQDQEPDRLNGTSDSEPALSGHDDYHPHLLCINHLRLSSCHPLDLNDRNNSENHLHHQADNVSENSDNTSKSTAFNRLMVNDCSSDSNQYSPLSSISHSGDYQSEKKRSNNINNTGKQVLDKNSDEYRLRRERNNIAVRKSRSKSKLKFVQTVERISQLEHENRVLINKVKSMSRDLNILKFILIKHVNGGLGVAAYDLDSDNFKADSMDSDQ